LLARGIENRFATIFFAILSPDGRLTYCNAGQNPPLLFSASGVRKLETGGMIVGLFPHATYEQEEVRLHAGDLLAVYSDGVSEALNPTGDEYGDSRIQDVISPNWLEPSDAVLQLLLRSVHAFAQDAPQNDDVTALIVRYTPVRGAKADRFARLRRFRFQHADLDEHTGEVVDASLVRDEAILDRADDHHRQKRRLAGGDMPMNPPVSVPDTVTTWTTRSFSMIRASCVIFRSPSALKKAAATDSIAARP
jgi:hypothetical protein